MDKLLILGASILQLPAIIKAKEMGFEVAVIDYNPNAIGVKYADHFSQISTIDKESILAYANKFRPNGIVTIATDMPMQSIAYVSKKLGLPGISQQTALKATDKGEMIKTFKKNNIACPWFFIIKSNKELIKIKKRLEYPCIFKPTDNSGSRGVILVNHETEAQLAYEFSKRYSRSGNVIIEEYMTGNEVSVEMLTINGNPYVIAVTDKITTGAPHFVEMGHSQPSRLSEEDTSKIKQLAVNAVKAIELENGPAHVEIMLTREGPKMIELGARLGGDNITTHLVPFSTGIDMVKTTIELAVGNIPNISPLYQLGSAIKYIKSNNGIIIDIKGIENARKVKGVKEIAVSKHIGDLVTDINSSLDRVGYIISQGENAEDALSICDKAMDFISINVI